MSDPEDLRARILRRFQGTEPRHELADWRLLGVDAARVMKLQKHFPANPVPAAVLVPLVDRPEGLGILLTQRASQLAKHAAQISFPSSLTSRHSGGSRNPFCLPTPEQNGSRLSAG